MFWKLSVCVLIYPNCLHFVFVLICCKMYYTSKFNLKILVVFVYKKYRNKEKFVLLYGCRTWCNESKNLYFLYKKEKEVACRKTIRINKDCPYNSFLNWTQSYFCWCCFCCKWMWNQLMIPNVLLCEWWLTMTRRGFWFRNVGE